MTIKKTVTLLVAGLMVWFVAAPAWAEGGGDGEEENKDGGSAVDANVNYFLSNPSPFAAGASGDTEEEYDESFYFGEGEEQIWLQKKIEKNRYQDRSGAASRSMKRVIGWTMITTGIVMAVWGAAFHYESRAAATSPAEYLKYERNGITPLVSEKKVYWPSIVAGIGVGGGGYWLMNKD